MNRFFWVLNFSILEDLSKGYMTLKSWCDCFHHSSPTSLHKSFRQFWPDGILAASDCWYCGMASVSRELGWQWVFIHVCPWSQVCLVSYLRICFWPRWLRMVSLSGNTVYTGVWLCSGVFLRLTINSHPCDYTRDTQVKSREPGYFTQKTMFQQQA